MEKHLAKGRVMEKSHRWKKFRQGMGNGKIVLCDIDAECHMIRTSVPECTEDYSCPKLSGSDQ